MFMRKVLSKDESLLEIQGVLSGETVADFQQHMEDLVAEGRARIILNLSGVLSISSSSIGKILHFHKMLAEQGRALEIRGCSSTLYQTFQMVKFDTLVKVQKEFTP